MIADQDTDIVYISEKLTKQFPEVADALDAALGNSLRTISGTKDIWCRDFMPIQLDTERFIQFRYFPDYLKGYPHLRTEDAAGLLDLTNNSARSNLVIDSGNVVRWNDAAIMTKKVFKENVGTEADVGREIKTLLEVDRLVTVPTEPFDTIGHSDGMVRFVDEKTVLVNDYTDVNPEFGKKLAKSLKGFTLIPFPYCPSDEQGPDPEIEPATGCYINFLQTRDTICVPAFGLADDELVAATLRGHFPKCRVISVPCDRLAKHGGVLNCVTWNIKAK